MPDMNNGRRTKPSNTKRTGIPSGVYSSNQFDTMTVVNRSVSSTHPDGLKALQALSSVLGLDDSAIVFNTTPLGNSDGFAVEMTVSAKNSFNAADFSYTFNGLLACSRAICKIVPESGLWGQMGASAELETLIESWIETASNSLVASAYVAADDKGKWH